MIEVILKFTSSLNHKKENNLLKYLHRKITLRKVTKLIARKKIVNLEIGSGPKKGKNNWITLDICDGCDIKYDLLIGIPFPDNSVDMIYSSHLLEHFYYKDLVILLRECHRILKINGRFSLCVPDASIYIMKYLNPDRVILKDLWEPAFTFNSPIDYINYIAYMGTNHRYMFDKNNIDVILKNTGFKEGSYRKFKPELDIKERNWESIYYDAIK